MPSEHGWYTTNRHGETISNIRSVTSARGRAEGVMKKCLKMWLKGTAQNKKIKWSKEIVAALNLNILLWNRQLPSDFNRKLRILQYMSYYKATEFRTILLYVGIVAFKDILADQEYTHFLLKSCS